MKAVVQNKLGEPRLALALNDLDEQEDLTANEVLIEVSLAAVHHGDLHLIRASSSIPHEPGYIRRGSEAVGVVRAVGPDVVNLKVGTRVVGFPAIGAWAQTVVVPSVSAIPIPDDISDEVAAQLFINYITARMILRGLWKTAAVGPLRDGAVLVTGATTVVARLVLHLLHGDGFHAIGLGRSEAGAKRVQVELSGLPVTATANPDWKALLTSSAAGRPIVAVADCVSGSLLAEIAPLLDDDCAIITYGSLDNGLIGLSGFDITDRQFLIRGVTFVRWFTEVAPEDQAADIAAAIALAYKLPSLFTVSNIFALRDFEQAVAAVEQPNRQGFVLLKPN